VIVGAEKAFGRSGVRKCGEVTLGDKIVPARDLIFGLLSVPAHGVKIYGFMAINCAKPWLQRMLGDFTGLIYGVFELFCDFTNRGPADQEPAGF
jgi:hypothetical protein